ncbi:MAG: exopolysaccharide biosynthesis protein [Methylococcaceae bacterium]|nr:exopolysaccharide biosynthesis protein [Methylococcaceae bacterium]
MERIKKALEKAQQQRQETAGQQSTTDQKRVEQIHNTDQISYSKTRKIEVSEQLLKKNRIVAGLDDDPRADLYKMLRTKVLQRMLLNKWNVLAVTSPSRGTGKSLTAINLAISIAMDANYSVLLADLDLRRPCIHDYFGMPAEPGLSDYFSGEKTISELLVHPGLEKMVVLPAGRPIKRSSDLLSTPKMLELADELKQRYPDRIVVVNLPPLLLTDDAMIYMPNVDACILVVAEGESSEDDIKKSIQMIDQNKLIGTVLNKADEVNLADDAD